MGGIELILRFSANLRILPSPLRAGTPMPDLRGQWTKYNIFLCIFGLPCLRALAPGAYIRLEITTFFLAAGEHFYSVLRSDSYCYSLLLSLGFSPSSVIVNSALMPCSPRIQASQGKREGYTYRLDIP